MQLKGDEPLFFRAEECASVHLSLPCVLIHFYGIYRCARAEERARALEEAAARGRIEQSEQGAQQEAHRRRAQALAVRTQKP
jgi:hypothetical protein